MGSAVFMAYTHAGKISPEKILENEEKSIFFILEIILLTTLLVLLIVIPKNILLEKYNTSDNYQNITQSLNNAINTKLKEYNN